MLALTSLAVEAYAAGRIVPSSMHAPALLVHRAPARASSISLKQSALDACVEGAADLNAIMKCNAEFGDQASSAAFAIDPALAVLGLGAVTFLGLIAFLSFPVVARRTGAVTVPEWYPEVSLPELPELPFELPELSLPKLPSLDDLPPLPDFTDGQTRKNLFALALLGATPVLTLLLIGTIVIGTPGVQTPFNFLDPFYPPRVAEVTKIKDIKDAAEAKAKAEAAKAKAEAEAKAKAEEAAKAAEEAKAAKAKPAAAAPAAAAKK